MADIDIEAVPQFPVYMVRLDETDDRIELDGLPLEPASEQSSYAYGIEAVARKARKQGLEAVRVKIKSNTGDTWDMVVTQDGEAIDTTPAPEDESEQPNRLRKLIRPAVIGVIALGGIGGTVAVVNAFNTDEPEPWTTPGVDAQIPIALPDDYSPHASWATSVAEGTDIKALDTGHILTVGTGGNLIARDPETAEPVWRSDTAPDDLTTLVQTHWGEQDALVAHSGQTLYVWDAPTGQGRSSSQALPIDHQWRSELNGPAPMIDMGDWIVGIPDSGYQLQQVVVPAGTRPLTATEDGHVITCDHNTFYRINADGDTTEAIRYSSPQDSENLPDHTWMLDDDHVLLGWNGEDAASVGIYRLSDGSEIITETIDRLPHQDTTPVFDTNGSAAALDGLAVSWSENAAAIYEYHELGITAVHDGIGYGSHARNDPATLDLTNDEATPEPWESYNSGDPAPDLVTDDGAYVIAPQLDQTILYQSRTTTGNEDSP